MPVPAPLELPSFAADALKGPLAAQDAVAFALDHSPVVRAARANLITAIGKYRQTGSALNPSLSLSHTYTRQETIENRSSSSVSVPTAYSSAVTLKQLLFDFDKSPNLTKAARLQVEASRQALRQAESDLALSVKSGFYTAFEAARLVAVAEANVKSRGLQLELAKARMGAGLGAPADVVRATTSFDDGLNTLVQARATALTARVQFAALLGLDPRSELKLSAGHEAAVASPKLPDLVASALSQRPEALAAVANLESARATRKASLANDSPSVALSLIYGAKGDRDPTLTQTGAAALSVTWPIWDGGFSHGVRIQADGQLASAEAVSRQTSLAVVSDVSQAFVLLQAAEQRLTIATAEEANALEGARLAEGRYRAGVGSFLEVTDAQAALVSAQTARVNAESGLDRARATLAHAVGPSLN
ncbi:MAG: TolC family protein [Fimbriimonas ginsengisoli]|uniref:TolC family protein n=1 Tax=Fimbriimonas ginsengisoli TaxID=1005039 RepID=A0A931LX68_FIMGI|nr:TolC family protein [Fimbriimonas ginsengisoli]